ncbi:MAG TPA: hypothetical protein VFP80_11420 [Thermoanaerobaculia bacterium]|nr:hypothetical protein [Thermoanaerobaculia bacterium]
MKRDRLLQRHRGRAVLAAVHLAARDLYQAGCLFLKRRCARSNRWFRLR